MGMHILTKSIKLLHLHLSAVLVLFRFAYQSMYSHAKRRNKKNSISCDALIAITSSMLKSHSL